MEFNFIDEFIDTKKFEEAPEAYWRWSALACIAAQLRNNLWTKTIGPKIYPNIFVILYGTTGMRKGSGPKFALSLLRNPKVRHTKIIAGRASMQKVVQEMAGRTNKDGVALAGGSMLLYSEELSAFMVEDPATIPLLTDLYDYHPVWDNQLVGGVSNVEEVCLTLLSASNSDMFRGAFSELAIKGGLLGRTFIVPANRLRHRRSLVDFSDYVIKDETPLIDFLKKLKTYKGEVNLSPDAGAYLTDWYNRLPEEISQDIYGFGSRLETHVLKVALNLSASRESFDYKIILDDVIKSIDLVTGIRSHYNQLTAGSGGASSSHQAALIIRAFLGEPGYALTFDKLMQLLFGDLDIPVAEEVLAKLSAADFVKAGDVNGNPGYRLTEQGINRFIGSQKTNGIDKR